MNESLAELVLMNARWVLSPRVSTIRLTPKYVPSAVLAQMYAPAALSASNPIAGFAGDSLTLLDCLFLLCRRIVRKWRKIGYSELFFTKNAK